MTYEMNIYELVRRAVASLDDNMEAAGRVPGPGQEPTFVYEPETNTYRLEILTVAREDCPHAAGSVAISVLSAEGTGRVITVSHCPVCKAIL